MYSFARPSARPPVHLPVVVSSFPVCHARARPLSPPLTRPSLHPRRCAPLSTLQDPEDVVAIDDFERGDDFEQDAFYEVVEEKEVSAELEPTEEQEI